MISAINAALSGFTAATNRINVNATNIANEFSTNTVTNGVSSNTPYVPQQTVQSALPTGGVLSTTQPITPSSVSVYDPGNAAAGSDGLTQLPNVDPAQQLVGINIASYDAQANLTVIKAENKTFQAVLNIVS